MTFIKGFGSYVSHGDSIDCTVDGITYTARLEFDADTHPCESEVLDEDAYGAWERDEWRYYGVVIDAERDGWTRSSLVSLWGVEGDHPADLGNVHLLEVANQLLPYAIDAAKASLAAITRAACAQRS